MAGAHFREGGPEFLWHLWLLPAVYPSYAKITVPPTNLLKKACTWEFWAEHRRAIALLKAEFVQSAVLAFPDPSKEYIIHLEASDSAVVATLSQEDSEGCVKLITCMSKKLNPAERNCLTHEREFLANLQALRHWRSANGHLIDCDSYVVVLAILVSLRFRISLRVVFSAMGVIWGIPFLRYFDPCISWREGTLTILRGCRE